MDTRLLEVGHTKGWRGLRGLGIEGTGEWGYRGLEGQGDGGKGRGGDTWGQGTLEWGSMVWEQVEMEVHREGASRDRAQQYHGW